MKLILKLNHNIYIDHSTLVYLTTCRSDLSRDNSDFVKFIGSLLQHTCNVMEDMKTFQVLHIYYTQQQNAFNLG